MLLMLAVGAFIVFLDHSSKGFVADRLPEGAVTSRDILGIRLRHVVNRRNPWRSRSGVRLMGILWVLCTVAAVFVAMLLDRPVIQIALGALVGGATGNLLEAVFRGEITDFIDLRVWPVFNVADAAIVTGAVLLLWDVIPSVV